MADSQRSADDSQQDADADFAVDVAEIQALRQEITNRTTLASALIALELTALATGLTLADKFVNVLAVLAGISSFLWLLWLDHSIQILKIAAYLGAELAPRLSARAGRPLLGWEGYLVWINAGGQGSARALYGENPPPGARFVRPWLVDWYSPLLFGAAPVALLGTYLYANLVRPGTPVALWATAIAIDLALWLLTIVRFFDFCRNSRTVASAIRARSGAATPTPLDGDPAQPPLAATESAATWENPDPRG